MSTEASKPPTPPAAFRSALLFPEDANLKAYATPDSPSENPLNQKRDSPQPALDAVGKLCDGCFDVTRREGVGARRL